MEDKKKVKSISSAEKKDKERENMSNEKKEKVDYDKYVSDMEIIKAYENKSKNRLKIIIAFILGIIATIALFSTLGLSNKNISTSSKNNTKEPAYIGIMMVDLEDIDSLEYYDLDDIETNLKKGVVVETVKAGGPAAGYLKKKDIITKFNRKDINTMDDLIDELGKHYSGEKAVFTVERDGKIRTISFILGSK